MGGCHSCRPGGDCDCYCYCYYPSTRDRYTSPLSSPITSYSGSADATTLKRIQTLTGENQEKETQINDLIEQITKLKVIINQHQEVDQGPETVNLFERAAFLKGRPFELDEDESIDVIIDQRRQIQLEENFILYETRDTDPEAPLPEKEFNDIAKKLFHIIANQRIKEPVAKQVIDMLQNMHGKAKASSILNRFVAKLTMLYDQSDENGVILCRMLQIEHKSPLPTLAALQFGRLHVEISNEDNEYRLRDIISNAYAEMNEHLGQLFIQLLQPDDLTPVEYTLNHLRIRCGGFDQAFIEEAFAEREVIPDTEFLPLLKEQGEIWIDDDAILDMLEDEMTIENAQALFVDPEIRMITEDELVRALADSFNENSRRDLTFLRSVLLEANNGEEELTEDVLAQIFTNEVERQTLFHIVDDYNIDKVLMRVLAYLEGDVIVKQQRQTTVFKGADALGQNLLSSVLKI